MREPPRIHRLSVIGVRELLRHIAQKLFSSEASYSTGKVSSIMRSIIRIPLLGCFAVLSLVAFVECLQVVSVPDSHNVKRAPGILAGEDTPVWIADRPDPSKPVVYTKLPRGIVKSALNYWQTKKSSDGFPIRQSRTFRDNHTKQPVSIERPHTENSSNPIMVNLVENEETTFLYPSVLVVVDYDYFLPMTKENEETVIKERIIYALAFWNSVAFDLKHIERPHIDLRIAGMVITRNRKASPYINTSEYYYSLVYSLQPMLDYWTHDANNAGNHDPDNTQGVPLGSYDIVAHMTDSYPYRKEGYKMYAGKTPQANVKQPATSKLWWGRRQELQLIFFPWRQPYPIKSIASESNPCAINYGVSGVIVYDDLAFLGIHTAVEKITNVFGDDSISWKQYTYDRKQWTQATLDKIHNGLKHADCMSAPKEYFPPGKRVFPPLAGDLLPRAKQCEAHGFNKRTYHCWNSDFWGLVTSTCKDLKCSNSFTSITCTYSNPTLDGTFCSVDNKKICMAGECVWAE